MRSGKGALVRRRRRSLLSLALAAAVAGAVAHPAVAQDTPSVFFEHDRSLDGTEGERESGYFSLAGSDPADPPEVQREELPTLLELLDSDDDYTPVPAELTFEAFEFTVGEDDVNGSFTVELNWGNPAIDLDLYVYRRNADGSLDGQPVAQSATADPEENALYVSPKIDNPVEPGTYAVFVDNWCTSNEDANSVELTEDIFGEPVCPFEAEDPDEDDFTGRVDFQPLVLSNRLPRNVRVSGPRTGRTGDRLTFTASAEDTDGRIVRYGFDLDGDGNFEYDNANSRSVTKLYDQPGTYNVGVRVIDDRGGVGYGDTVVTITGRPLGASPGDTKPVSARNLVSRFSLASAVFGGRGRNALRVAYRLRDPAHVDLAVYRGKGKAIRRVRTIFRGNRPANYTYRMKVFPRRLRRGTYTIRLAVRTADGRRRVVKLVAKRV